MNIHDVYRPLFTPFRKRRMQLFEELFRPSGATTILDVGGDEFNWAFISAKPKITLLNLDARDKIIRPGFTKIVGDGRRLPFPEKAFDIVYSNSVIEHVGDFDEQRAFAEDVMRVGRSFFVQTPDRAFPFEPHFMAPCFQYLPRSVKRKLARHFTVWGLVAKPDRQRIDEVLDSIRLLNGGEMKELFREGKLLRERFCGLPKSLVAYKKSIPAR